MAEAAELTLKLLKLGQSTRRCPTLPVNIEKLRTAKRLFNKYFPKAVFIRHAVAHAGETQYTLKQLEAHQYDGTLRLGGITLSGIAGGHIIHGRTVYMTHNKKLVSMEVTPAKNEQLKSVVEAVFEAFTPASQSPPRTPPAPAPSA
jgi:hypothetical protein